MDKILDSILKNKYLALALILNNVHTIYTKTTETKTMQSISTDIIEIIIKLIMIAIIIGLLTKYERLKELLFISRYSNQLHTYQNIAEGMEAVPNEIKKMYTGAIEREKNIMRKALTERYPKKNKLDIEKLMNEYYA